MQPFVGVDGELYSTVPGSGVFTLHDDLGLDIFDDVRPCFALVGVACLITGKFSRPVVYYDDIDEFHPAGLEAPTGTPTAASGGAGNVEGEAIYYYTFVHEDGGVRAESNPSPASNTFSASSNSVSITGMDATAPDARVNKLYVYSARDGALARKVGSVALGTTTFTDNVSDETLSEQTPLPSKLDADGLVVLDPEARGIPPYTEICIAYHNRAWLGRDPDNPHFMWYSNLNEPEGFNLSTPDPTAPPLGTLKTKKNYGVRGFVEAQDELLALHEGGVDGVQGYGPTTFQVRTMTERYTSINHHSIAVTGDGIPIWAGEDGFQCYDGAFRGVMENRRDEFIAALEANPDAYQDSVASYDRRDDVYKLLIPDTGGPSRYWIGHCLPMVLGQSSSPFWTDDYENREVTAIGNLRNDPFEKKTYQHAMGADGYLRRHNVASDPSDDTDTYLKHMAVKTKAFLPRGSQGGDDGHGVTVTDMTVFVKNQNQDVIVTGYAGDDLAYTADPTFTRTIPAASVAVDGVVASPKTSHHIGEVDYLSGKTVLIGVDVDSPVGVEFRGVEFLSRSGSQTQPA